MGKVALIKDFLVSQPSQSSILSGTSRPKENSYEGSKIRAKYLRNSKLRKKSIKQNSNKLKEFIKGGKDLKGSKYLKCDNQSNISRRSDLSKLSQSRSKKLKSRKGLFKSRKLKASKILAPNSIKRYYSKIEDVIPTISMNQSNVLVTPNYDKSVNTRNSMVSKDNSIENSVLMDLATREKQGTERNNSAETISRISQEQFGRRNKSEGKLLGNKGYAILLCQNIKEWNSI